MQVVEVNEIDQLESHRGEWTRLLAATPSACFFQSLEWLSIYWRHFGRDQRLRTLLVYDGDQLIGILPLAIKGRSTKAVVLRTLGYPLDGWGTTYGPIGADVRTVMAAGLSHLQQTARDWDVLELDWSSESLVADVHSAFEPIRPSPQVFTRAELSLVDLTQPWDRYWKKRNGKHRNNVRRAEKKLAAMGSLQMLHHRVNVSAATDARWDLYDTCESVCNQSWQGRSTTGTTLTSERVRDFLRDVHEAATSMGAVSIHLLSVDGEPAAFSYNYVFQGAEFGLRMGYAPKFKSGNPGTVLIHRMLQDAFGSDQRWLDLGEGDAPYKHEWRTQATLSYRLCYYASTSLRAQALRWKRRWTAKNLGSFKPSQL